MPSVLTTQYDTSQDAKHIRYLENNYIPKLEATIQELDEEIQALKNSIPILIAAERERLLTQQVTREADFYKELAEKEGIIQALRKRIKVVFERIKEYKIEIEYLKEALDATEGLKTESNAQQITISSLRAQLKNSEDRLESIIMQGNTLQPTQSKEDEESIPDFDTESLEAKMTEGEKLLDTLARYISDFDQTSSHSPNGNLAQELERANEPSFFPYSDRFRNQNCIKHLISQAAQYPANILIEICQRLEERDQEISSESKYEETSEASFIASWQTLLPPRTQGQTGILLPTECLSNPKSLDSVPFVYTYSNLEQHFPNQSLRLTPNILLKQQQGGRYSLIAQQRSTPSFFQVQPSAQIIAHILIALAYQHYNNVIENDPNFSDEDARLEIIINEAHPLAQEVVDYLTMYQRFTTTVPFSISNFSNPHTTLTLPSTERIDHLITQLLPDEELRHTVLHSRDSSSLCLST